MGAVADRLGLSVRTLHHWDEKGLVTPSHRSTGGFRLYTENDIARLHPIRRMKPLGFSLEEMRELLDFPLRWPTTRPTPSRCRTWSTADGVRRRAERIWSASSAGPTSSPRSSWTGFPAPAHSTEVDMTRAGGAVV